jgi:Cu2+-exporting ATPase
LTAIVAIEPVAGDVRKDDPESRLATGYNLVRSRSPAGLLVPWGIDPPMAVDAITMSVSRIVVAANAQLLRRLRLRPDRTSPRLRLVAA